MEEIAITSLNIKSWAEEDRPREKMLLKGKAALTDAELLGILINSGVQNLTAVDIGKEILRKSENDLNQLGKLNIKELSKFKGIGEARAITIIAALELGRRRKETESVKKPIIKSSRDVYQILKPSFWDLMHEEFWIVLLNRANQVIKSIQISAGGVAGTVVDPKIVFKVALENLASGIVLAHNHPSGNLKPSQEDINLTKKIKEGGQILDISILDHLIVTDNGYYSFADESIL
jgi:DNA repair protein RadC